MDLVFTGGTAVGLAMDALAVSVASGIAIKNLRVRHAIRIAFFFGSFQALMPVIGWLAGTALREHIAAVDHWVAFGLLGLIGGKMIYESFALERERPDDPLNIAVLLVLSLATSIDALAVGVTFSFVQQAIVLPVIIIGLVTFTLSFAGVYIGDRIGHFFERKMEFAGGIILIGIGVKLVIEHIL